MKYQGFKMVSYVYFGASLVAQMIKNLLTMQETWVRPLGQKDLLKEMATHSNILASRIPQRSQASYSPWGHKESDQTE